MSHPPVLSPVRSVVAEESGRTLAFVVGALERFLRRTTRTEWGGLEHVPRQGGVILAANHVSHYDPLVLGHFIIAAGRWPRYLGKESLFRIPLLGRLITACEQIPVHRGSSRALDALAAAADALESGKAITIYPEGTISKEPQRWPMVARTGVIRLALQTGVPVIPVAQWGAQRVMPSGSSLPRFWPPQLIQVTAGPAVDLADLVDRGVSAETLAIGGERVMAAITKQLADIRGETPPTGRWDDRRKAYLNPEAPNPESGAT